MVALSISGFHFHILVEEKNNAHRLRGRRIFINSLPSQFAMGAEHPVLQRLFAEHGKHTVIEITEDDPISAEIASAKIEAIHQSGSFVAIDDYGAGFSSQNALMLSPDYVKIDMSLITNIHLVA